MAQPCASERSSDLADLRRIVPQSRVETARTLHHSFHLAPVTTPLCRPRPPSVKAITG